MRAAYSYTRFSSAGQKGNNSTDRQIEEGREWYAEHIAPLGIPLDESFTDTARSAYKGEHVGKHGDLGRFLAAIQSGAVSKGSILIAENADRLSRQGEKIGRKLLEAIVDNGVDVHIVTIPLKLTYGWENRREEYILVDAELNRAFKESQRKSKIIRIGIEAVKYDEDWCGILPFWLEKIYEPGATRTAKGKKTNKPKYSIAEIPEKADLVREIFRLSAQGLGAKRIMEDLDSRGIPCSLSLGRVGHLLRNRAVLGEHQPKTYLDSGTVIDGDPIYKFPRIVDQTEFDMVAARLDGKKKVCSDGKLRPATGNRYSNKTGSLFDGLLFDVTDAPHRTLHFQKKEGANNPYLISKWEPNRHGNRIRYDLFETTFLNYLTEADWKAIAGEKETEELKKARTELNLVRAERDRADHLLARRIEQMNDPDLPDAVAKEFATQIVAIRERIATLTEQENRLDGTVTLESRKAEALRSPERLIAMIKAGDPAMRLAMRTELQRMISRIELDFAIEPDRITITVTFINDVQRSTAFRKPIRFTKPLHPQRSRRVQLLTA